MKFPIASIAVYFFVGFLTAQAKPLKVFILAGQSNMQGHAMISTFDYIGRDPRTAPMLAQMRDANGQPTICDKVWINYLSEDRNGRAQERIGKLTAGFGATPEKIGPEFTFGLTMEKALDEPILLIKTAWGGKSLNTDFRPPSAGPFVFTDADLARIQKQGKDLVAEKAAKAAATGHYYRLMMAHVKNVLADPKELYPAYDSKEGYEIAGFVWFQGFNDLVDGNFYPNRHQPGGYDEYGRLLAHFIRDVRNELKTPQLPFVIGVIGVGGLSVVEGETPAAIANRGMRSAMAMPGQMPEFKGTVAHVMTANFWDPLQDSADQKKWKIKAEIDRMKKKEGKTFARGEEETLFEAKMKEACTAEELEAFKGISNQAYHYLGSAKILGGIGKAFAEAMTPMVKK
jgi:alpha-galactosidase